MRNKSDLKLMEEITILNQFLYMDENNYVEFKKGDFIRILKINEIIYYHIDILKTFITIYVVCDFFSIFVLPNIEV